MMESWGGGGTETYVSGLAQAMHGNGLEVSLVLLKSGNEARIDFLPPERIFVAGLVGAAGIMGRVRPDVVNLHLYTSLLPTTLMARLLGIRTVATLHMPPSAWGLRHRLCWRLAMRLSDKVVGVSRRVVEEIRSRNRHPRPLPGGIASSFFECGRRIRESDGRFHIAAVGRLAAEKDWPTLIEAVSQLPADKRKRVVVDFYGSGPLQTGLDALAQRLSVEAVFHGHVDRAALVSALAVSDLAVLPSRFEGLGLSALESMAAGVPTVTADFAAASEFIEHGVTGHMFPAGDAPALAQRIDWHIENPAGSEAMARLGRDFVRQHFSEEVTYLPYLEIFRQAAN